MSKVILNKNNLLKRSSKIFYLIAGGALVACLGGCGSEDDLGTYINKIKNRPTKKVEPIPKVVPPAKFSYPENTSRRNPFKAISAAQKKDEMAPNIDRPKQPLEAFPLDALKFVGTVEINRVRWGLISQPGGLVSRVKSGDYMGKNYGQIQQISKEQIRLEETVKVGGKWEKRIVNLKLRKP